MPIALDFMLMERGIVHGGSQWALRYVMMLWLSLIVMIPFDLAQFDDESALGHIARSLENVGKSNLGKAGLERDAAALLLSRLYTRCAILGILCIPSLFNSMVSRKDMKYAFPEFARTLNTGIRSQAMDVITVSPSNAYYIRI